MRDEYLTAVTHALPQLPGHGVGQGDVDVPQVRVPNHLWRGVGVCPGPQLRVVTPGRVGHRLRDVRVAGKVSERLS